MRTAILVTILVAMSILYAITSTANDVRTFMNKRVFVMEEICK